MASKIYVAFYGRRKGFLFYAFLIPKKQKGVKKMQSKKVVFINKFDTKMLDEDFYIFLLKNIEKLKAEKQEKKTK